MDKITKEIEDKIIENIQKRIKFIFTEIASKKKSFREKLNKKRRPDKKDARDDKAKKIAEYIKEMKVFIEAREKVKKVNIQEDIDQKDDVIHEKVNKLVKDVYNKVQKQSLFLSDTFLHPKDFEKYNREIMELKKNLKKKLITQEQFKTWRTNYLVRLYSEPIIKSLEKLFFRYRNPYNEEELYFDLIAIYLCYLFPKMPPPDFHYYIDTMAIDLSRRNGGWIAKNSMALNVDFSKILFRKSYRQNTLEKISKFRKIWEERVENEPDWLEYTKTETERVRYILNRIKNKDDQVSVQTGLKYLRVIEKERRKI